MAPKPMTHEQKVALARKLKFKRTQKKAIDKKNKAVPLTDRQRGLLDRCGMPGTAQYMYAVTGQSKMDDVFLSAKAYRRTYERKYGNKDPASACVRDMLALIGVEVPEDLDRDAAFEMFDQLFGKIRSWVAVELHFKHDIPVDELKGMDKEAGTAMLETMNGEASDSDIEEVEEDLPSTSAAATPPNGAGKRGGRKAKTD